MLVQHEIYGAGAKVIHLISGVPSTSAQADLGRGGFSLAMPCEAIACLIGQQAIQHPTNRNEPPA